MTEQDLIIKYKDSIRHEKKAVIDLLSTMDYNNFNSVFAYGNPLGEDIDLCFITSMNLEKKQLEYHINQATNSVVSKYNFDIVVTSLNDFFNMIKEHGHKAVEFRTLENNHARYLKNILKRKNLNIPIRNYDKILKYEDYEEMGFLL